MSINLIKYYLSLIIIICKMKTKLSKIIVINFFLSILCFVQRKDIMYILFKSQQKVASCNKCFVKSQKTVSGQS